MDSGDIIKQQQALRKEGSVHLAEADTPKIRYILSIVSRCQKTMLIDHSESGSMVLFIFPAHSCRMLPAAPGCAYLNGAGALAFQSIVQPGYVDEAQVVCKDITTG